MFSASAAILRASASATLYLLALANVAGAGGLLIDMQHPNPDKAMSDGAQSLYPAQLNNFVRYNLSKPIRIELP